ncbi:uncharacterized protein LOC127704765 [Mytilus californianus]|uniref:uncharacterized protein LOC127704765 n=1 Tax=Mytilus californianus TaxID=6549 RepID=UPI0022476430|nr:uncharacterized protein LOC127704765 [Mytilus californianus]
MLNLVCTILLIVPQILKGQQNIKDGKITGSSQITCPEISCELHHFPQEHCKVQTFIMYHGVKCQSCVEDICHGSQVVADSLIGDVTQVQNLNTVDNTNAVTGNLKKKWNKVSYINRLGSIFGNNPNVGNLRNPLEPENGRTGNNQQMQEHGLVTVNSKGMDRLQPKSQIKCPEIECHHHHQPKAHCMVDSYFIYHGEKCKGCIEDICLGSHIVDEILIGKNKSQDSSNPETLSLKNQGVGERMTSGDWRSGNAQPPLIERRSHDSNGQINQEPLHPNHHQEPTERLLSGNWRSRHSQPPLSERHIQFRNGQINHEHTLPNQHQGAGDRILSGHWRSRNPQPLSTEIGLQNSNGQLNLSRNPFFSRGEHNFRNKLLGVQTNKHINSKHDSGRNSNPNSSTNISASLPNGQNTKNNEESIVVVDQKQSSFTRKDRGIGRFRGKGRSYLQSLFHPAFTG